MSDNRGYVTPGRVVEVVGRQEEVEGAGCDRHELG